MRHAYRRRKGAGLRSVDANALDANAAEGLKYGKESPAADLFFLFIVRISQRDAIRRPTEDKAHAFELQIGQQQRRTFSRVSKCVVVPVHVDKQFFGISRLHTAHECRRKVALTLERIHISDARTICWPRVRPIVSKVDSYCAVSDVASLRAKTKIWIGISLQSPIRHEE